MMESYGMPGRGNVVGVRMGGHGEATGGHATSAFKMPLAAWNAHLIPVDRPATRLLLDDQQR